MSRLGRLQDEMQRAILAGDDTVLGRIADGPREPRGVLLGVYRDAYVLRLAEVLRNDHGLLHAYLGDEGFDDMARAYIAATPSRSPNARWFSRALPDFLAATEPYRSHPEIAELAAIEKALNDAFDACDAALLDLARLAEIEPGDWPALTFTPHPSARVLTLATNALDIWTALSAGAEPPQAAPLESALSVIVWRADETPRIRAMSVEEAMMWREAVKGVRFSVLCELLATFDDPETAATRAASHLQGWLAAGLLSGAAVAPALDSLNPAARRGRRSGAQRRKGR